MDKGKQNFEYIKASKKTRYTHYLSEAAHNYVRSNKYIIELLAEGSYTAIPAEDTQGQPQPAPARRPSFSQPSPSRTARSDELVAASDPHAAEKLASQEATQPYVDTAKAEVDRIMKEAYNNAR